MSIDPLAREARIDLTRVDGNRPPDGDPRPETLRRALDHYRATAQRTVDGAARRAGKRLRRLSKREATLATLLRRTADAESSLVKGRAVGGATVSRLRDEADDLRTRVAEETAAGIETHRRLTRWYLGIPWIVAAVDFAVLLYFLFDALNGPRYGWRSLPGATAIVLALIGATASLLWLSVLGHCLKARRGPRGEILWSTLGALLIGQLLVGVVLVAALGALMFNRVGQKLVDGDVPNALFLATVFAVISAIGNLAIVLIHAVDGSIETERLDALTRAVRRAESRAHRRRDRAERQRSAVVSGVARVESLALDGVTRARAQLAASGPAGERAGLIGRRPPTDHAAGPAPYDPTGNEIRPCTDGSHAATSVCTCRLATVVFEAREIRARALASRVSGVVGARLEGSVGETPA